MGCIRVPHCPVFPYLSTSLPAWRVAYCDSDTGWQACERFRRFTAGQPVPLPLLPNGKIAAALAVEVAADSARRDGTPLAAVPPARARLPWWRRLLRWRRVVRR